MSRSVPKQMLIALIALATFLLVLFVSPRFLASWSVGNQTFCTRNEKLLPQVLSYSNLSTSIIAQDTDYSYAPIYISCRELGNQLKNHAKLSRFELNRLRRQVALTNPDCFQKKFRIFLRLFREKLKQVEKHVNLHIPKAGGTSVCSMINHNGHFNTNKSEFNCWSADFAPTWCCRPGQPPTSCLSLQNLSEYPTFVMNENYLDVPLCPERIYSMLLRNPTDRAISMVENLARFTLKQHPVIHKEGMGARLNLAQSNYMTWALVVSKRLLDVTDETEMGKQVLYYEPQAEDVPLAAQQMMELDFLVDMFVPQWHDCMMHMIQLFGWVRNESKVRQFPKSNVQSKDKNSYAGYRRSVYNSLNELDHAIYAFSQDILLADCHFFMQVPVPQE